MRRLTIAGAVVLAVLALAPTGATAQTRPDPSRLRGPVQGGNPVSPIDGETNPVLSCRQNNNTVLVEFAPGESGPFELPSFRSCVTSLAQGRLSYVAFSESCRQQEGDFAASNPSGQPYPYSFYGNPNYTAFNRRDCIYFLWAFHTGALPPGPGA